MTVRLVYLSILTMDGRASEEGQKKLQSMEEAFTKLKQITGVQNVGDMHEKFSNQKSNKLQLEVEVCLSTCYLSTCYLSTCLLSPSIPASLYS